METDRTCVKCGYKDTPAAFKKGSNLCLECEASYQKNRDAQNRARSDDQIVIPITARCTICGIIQPSANFHRNRANLNGLADVCKACKSQLHQEWLSRCDYRIRKIKLMTRNARIRAQKSEVAYDLDEEWMMQQFLNQKTCPILSHRGADFDLDWDSKKIGDHSPSLDRFDNTKGYTKDNVWVISQLANSIKCNASLNTLVVFGQFWLDTVDEHKLSLE